MFYRYLHKNAAIIMKDLPNFFCKYLCKHARTWRKNDEFKDFLTYDHPVHVSFVPWCIFIIEMEWPLGGLKKPKCGILISWHCFPIALPCGIYIKKEPHKHLEGPHCHPSAPFIVSEKKCLFIGFMVFKSTGSDSRFQRKNQF